MENASKALIIAGAILISILLIGIGMMIYNSAIKPVTDAGDRMDEMSKNMFNGKFENYEGSQRGSNIKTLISTVITSNAQNEDGLVVTVNEKSSSADLSALRSAIVDGKTYTVKIEYDNNGLVSKITYK